MQSNLEKEALIDRRDALARNDYERVDEYNEMHPDALSDGDPQGKGTGNGGHIATIPDFTKSPTSYSYQIDTNGGGGEYDIKGGPGGLYGNSGREYLQNINTYSPGAGHEYNETHPNALSDGDVQGKGHGNGYSVYTPDWTASHTSPNYVQGMKTDGGGGKYDIEGRPDIAGSGRRALTTINLYGEGREYGENQYAINTDANVNDGQYKITL